MSTIYSTLNCSKKNTLPAPLPALFPRTIPPPLPPPLHPSLPPPLPAKRKQLPPPTVNRENKPEIITFKEGVVEESY